MTAAHAASGTVAPGFEGVRTAFEATLTEHAGGAFAALADGVVVADLWGGLADEATGRPWEERTAAVIFSGTKGIVATALLLLVERGQLDLAVRVADVWPEFAAHGKGAITVEQLLSHCGGLAGVAGPVALDQPRAIARALAAQATIVPVGTPSYHALTYGWLAGELVCRVDGRELGEFVRDELAGPLGDLDLRLGLAGDDALASRRAQLRQEPGFQLSAFGAGDPDPRLALVYGPAGAAPEVWNDPGVLALGVPAAGGVATARAMAALYSGVVCGEVVTPSTLAEGLRPAGVGDDPLTGRALCFGPTGYELAGTPSALGPAAGAFGHTGAGGSSHGAWPSLRTGFSYVTAELRSESGDARAESLLAALHDALGGLMGERPNILLVMADQLAASHLPAYGNPSVHAPRLTQLAREGVVFENAYCASPLCAPSRFSLLAGRRPSSIGAYDNAAELPAGTATVAHVLRAGGYATALAGKMHFVGPDQLHGFEERLTTDVYPSDFDWTPDWRLPAGERLEWYHNTTSLLSARVAEAAMQTDYDDEVCFRAVQKLRDLSLGEDARPFFLTVSFTNPHDPWEMRERYWDLYDPAAIPLPTVGTIPRAEADAHSLRLRDMSLLDERPLSDAEVRRARHGYYASVSYLDERVGELLDALGATGLDRSTLVLFTADHGELLGERGLWYKMSFLDGSARVPLLARGPGLAPRRVSGPVSQLDIAATLADLAGADAGGAAFEGTSLAAALAGSGDGPGEALGEYLAEGVTAPAVMIRRGHHKYVRCPGDPDLLYDLAVDPHELRSLAGEPAGSELAAAFRAESDARWNLGELERRVLESQRERHLVARALSRGAYTPWDFQPFSDASYQYVRSGAAVGLRPGRSRPAGGLPPSAAGT